MEINPPRSPVGWTRPGNHPLTAAVRRWLAIGLLPLALIYRAWGEVSATHHPFPGIACYSERRAQPPTRLFVAEIDLTNPKVRLRVAPGGTDPDGPGPWQTTLLPPTRIAARENMDLVVNGDFFRARGVKDAEGTNATFQAASLERRQRARRHRRQGLGHQLHSPSVPGGAPESESNH